MRLEAGELEAKGKGYYERGMDCENGQSRAGGKRGKKRDATDGVMVMVLVACGKGKLEGNARMEAFTRLPT